MRCLEPFVKAGEVYPCGQCLPCLFRKRRIWFCRILLEASQHEFSSVVTLTYDQENCPRSGDLDPSHLRNWLKRYRRRVFEKRAGRRVRFYACGEYGETTLRPHFHVVLFGQPSCFAGRTGGLWCGDCQCVSCSDVVATWTRGVSSIDALTPQSASYVSGYVTRKMISKTLPGKLKPFTRMSNRPGIGANAMWDVASTLLTYDLENKPLPVVLGLGRSRLVLGRYLRSQLAKCLDKKNEQTENLAVQMVCDYAFAHSTSPREVFRQINEPYGSVLLQREALKRGSL